MEKQTTLNDYLEWMDNGCKGPAPFYCTSNPHSTLNFRRFLFRASKVLWSMANQGLIPKSEAAAHLNRDRAKLNAVCRHLLGGKAPTKHESAFDWNIDGIPCGVFINWINYPCDGFEGEACFKLLDRSGYHAKWLENKMDKTDEQAIQHKILSEYTSYGRRAPRMRIPRGIGESKTAL